MDNESNKVDERAILVDAKGSDAKDGSRQLEAQAMTRHALEVPGICFNKLAIDMCCMFKRLCNSFQADSCSSASNPSPRVCATSGSSRAEIATYAPDNLNRRGTSQHGSRSEIVDPTIRYSYIYSIWCDLSSLERQIILTLQQVLSSCGRRRFPAASI